MDAVIKLFAIVARSSESGDETVIHCHREVLMECLAAAKAYYRSTVWSSDEMIAGLRARADELESAISEERERGCLVCNDFGFIAWKDAAGATLVARCPLCEFREKVARVLPRAEEGR